jgi:DNA-3-methyladenine glycosylase II
MRSPVQQSLAEADPVLGSIIQQIPMPEITSTHNVFHDLMSCVIEQQIHYRSTKKIFANMLRAAGLEQLHPENFAHFEQKAFANSRLAEGKFDTMARIIDFWESNHVDWASLKDMEVRNTLASIKGIGRWTIDMILLYTLQRPAVFPCDDYHLKQIMVSLYGLDAKTKLKAQMMQVTEAWGQQASLAVLYLLDWKNSRKPRIFER